MYCNRKQSLLPKVQLTNFRENNSEVYCLKDLSYEEAEHYLKCQGYIPMYSLVILRGYPRRITYNSGIEKLLLLKT